MYDNLMLFMVVKNMLDTFLLNDIKRNMKFINT